MSQSEVIQAEDLVPFLPVATDYLRALLLIQQQARPPSPPSSAPHSGWQNVHTCERHLALMWSLAFYLMENYEHEVSIIDCIKIDQPIKFLNYHSFGIHYGLQQFLNTLQIPDREWCSTLVQLAISTAGKSSTTHSIYLLLLSGIERLVVAGKLVVGEVFNQVQII